MKKVYILLLSVLFLNQSCQENKKKPDVTTSKPAYAIVIHGGAGNITHKRVTPEKEKLYRVKLQEALDLGVKMLQADSPAISVVENVIRVLENSPLFNAGKGSVFTADGKNEMDASIMDGKTHNAGGVASVNGIKNPISAARLVMEKSAHVLLVKEGALQFARENGLEMVDSSYFFTKERWESLQRLRGKIEKHGTVGCAVLDKLGNLAAGTSTGGMTNKKYGRVGDSPIIGAGTYADNATCAVSCTGHGEYFMRYTVASDLAARMRYKKIPLKQAADEIINHELKDIKASGGLIAVDKNGNIAMTFNTSGMFRAYAKEGEKGKVLIFKN